MNKIWITISTIVFAIFTGILLVSHRYDVEKHVYDDAVDTLIECRAIDTINKYGNPDTSKYEPQSIEMIRITSEQADSMAIAVLCRAVDYYANEEFIALKWHNKWADLANRFYKVKDYDSYKAILWKADSCLSSADDAENRRLEFEKSVDSFKLGKYGENPMLLEFSLVGDKDTLKQCTFVLTNDYKPINHKYNGRN